MLQVSVQYIRTLEKSGVGEYSILIFKKAKAGGEGGDRGWDGWMASPTQRTWVWASSGRWWRAGKPGVLRPKGSQRAGGDRGTEEQQQKAGGEGLPPAPPSSNVIAAGPAGSSPTVSQLPAGLFQEALLTQSQQNYRDQWGSVRWKREWQWIPGTARVRKPRQKSSILALSRRAVTPPEETSPRTGNINAQRRSVSRTLDAFANIYLFLLKVLRNSGLGFDIKAWQM